MEIQHHFLYIFIHGSKGLFYNKEITMKTLSRQYIRKGNKTHGQGEENDEMLTTYLSC